MVPLSFNFEYELVVSIDTTCNKEKPNFGICSSRSGNVFKWKIDEKCSDVNIQTCFDPNETYQDTIIAAAKEHFIAVIKKPN